MITVGSTPNQPAISTPTVTATNYTSKVLSVNGVNCTIAPYIAVPAGFAAQTVTGTPQPILVSFNQNVADFSISIVNNTAAGSYIVGYNAAGNQIAVSEAAYSSTASSTLRVTVSAPAGQALGAVRLFAAIVGVAWTNISLTPTPTNTTVSIPTAAAAPQTQTPLGSAPTTPTVSTPTLTPTQQTVLNNELSNPNNLVPITTQLIAVQPGGSTVIPVTTPVVVGPVTNPNIGTTIPQPTVSTGPNTTSLFSQSLAIGLDTIVQISTQELAYVYVLNTMQQLATGSFTLENISNYIDLNVFIAAPAGVIFSPSSFVLPNLTSQQVIVSFNMAQINQLPAGLNDLSSVITLGTNNVNTNVTPVVNTPAAPQQLVTVMPALGNWVEQRYTGSPGSQGKMPEAAIFAQTPFLTQVVSTISYIGNNAIPAGTTVQWTSTQDFGTSGAPWVLGFTTADGMRLYVDGVLILNGWVDQSATAYATTQNYTGQHQVIVQYYNDHENPGTAIFAIVPQSVAVNTTPISTTSPTPVTVVPPGTQPRPSNNQVAPITNTTIPHPAVIGNTSTSG